MQPATAKQLDVLVRICVVCYIILCILLLFAVVSASSESSLVETESIGQVFLIGINRPEKHNCVNQATAQQLWDAVKHFETDEELRVAVLYGKGLTCSDIYN